MSNNENLPLEFEIEEWFKKMIEDIDNKFDNYAILIVANDEHWEHPLPDLQLSRLSQDGPKVFAVQIANWTREQSYYDPEKNGFVLTIAFGEDENYGFIPSEDIMGILNSDGIAVFVKSYHITRPAKKEKSKPEVSESGVKNSMDAMLKNNPNLKKKK